MTCADTALALQALKEGGYTCVLQRGEEQFVSERRGVAPLLAWLEQPCGAGFCAADKVVGKAAAFLYALLQVKEVYAQVISEPAVQTLKRFSISVDYETLVPAIRNRDGSGFCPMESAVLTIDEPTEALQAIVHKLKQLQAK